MPHCLATDIREIAERLGDDAKRFAGSTILLCGVAGFFVRYFSSVFAYLNQHMLADRPCRVIVCDNLITSGALGPETSQPDGFRCNKRNIIQPLESYEPFDYVIQAAGIASPYYYRKYPLETLEVATLGTKQVLSLGLKSKLRGFLYFSSSEIYGDPDPEHVPTPESYRGN